MDRRISWKKRALEAEACADRYAEAILDALRSHTEAEVQTILRKALQDDEEEYKEVREG